MIRGARTIIIHVRFLTLKRPLNSEQYKVKIEGMGEGSMSDILGVVDGLEDDLTRLFEGGKVLGVEVGEIGEYFEVAERFLRNVVNKLEVGGFEEEGLRGRIDSAVAVLEVGGRLGKVKRKLGVALGGGFEKECVELLFPGFEEVEEGGSHDEGTPSRYVTVFGDYLLNLTRQFEETNFGNLEGGEVTGASNEIVEEFMDKEEVRSWK